MNFKDAVTALLDWGLFCLLYMHCFHTGYALHALFSNRTERLKRKTKNIRRVKGIKGGQQNERETPLSPEGNSARVKHQWPVIDKRIVQCYAILSLSTFKFLFEFIDWSAWAWPAFSWLLWMHWCIQRGKMKSWQITDYILEVLACISKKDISSRVGIGEEQEQSFLKEIPVLPLGNTTGRIGETGIER